MFPDMKTVMLLYAITNTVCIVFMAIIWNRNRRRFAGISFWLTDMVLQAVGATLIVLRGIIPDFISIVVADTMIISGLLIIYIGLERFIEKKSSQIHNYILVGILIVVLIYFTYVRSNINARNFLIFAITLIFTFQCAWLMLRRVAPNMRRSTRIVGIVFSGYAFISIIRIIFLALFPLHSSDFFKSGAPDTFIIIFYIIFAVGLVSSLIIMVNGRLVEDISIYAKQLEGSELRYKMLSEQSRIFTWEVDEKGLYTFIDHMVVIILGYNPEDLLYKKHFYDLCPPEEQEVLKRSAFEVFKRKEQFINLENKAISKDGHTVWLSTNGIPILKDDGTLLGYRGSDTDITERKKAQEEIKSLAKFPEENPNPVGRIDFNGKLLYCNNEYERIFKDNIPSKIKDAIKKIAAEKIFSEIAVEIEVGDRTFLFNLVSIKKERYINFYGNDITERRQAELNAVERMKELQINRILLNNVGEIAHVGGWTFNTKTLTQTWTDETFRILEIDLTKGEPKIPEGLDFIVPAFRPMAEQAVQKAIEFVEPFDQEWEVITAKGNRRWVHAVAKVDQGQDKIKNIIGSFQDITERKNKESKILHLSYHDVLTGLYNRRFFEEEIKRLDTERQLPLSIMMGDLNGLKIINDVFGHSEGDKIIKGAAEILKKVCRSDDILARRGGDEFVILLPKTSISNAEEIVQRIKKECKKIASQKIPLSLSIGIATKISAKQDIQAIIIDAESNMYKNKLIEKESNTSSIIITLEQALYEKSTETREHTDRICDFAMKLGKAVELPPSQLDELSLLATLHDIGKVAISEKILLKKGPLTEKEREVIKRHPEIGFNIAASSPQIVHIAKYILSCHENWDSSGYPQGLKGEAIPILSRIIFICDAYDVMTNERSYKKAMGRNEAIKELKRCAGIQFDPVLVEKFIEIISKSSYKT